jgi:hypothetical protein
LTAPEHHHPDGPAPKGDCGCGCNGAGDCADAKQPASRARRSMLMGAGTVAFIATLGNRRAFASQCGPISNAASMNPSATTGSSSCGGLTPGFWKNHIGCAGTTLGFAESPSNNNYTTDLNNFLTSTTLGSILTNLSAADSVSAGQSFAYAFCTPSSAASHWACAILNAKSPGFNPSYGYTITSLNAAILSAVNQNVSGSSILTALETLENDTGTGNTSSCASIKVTGCS